MRSVDATAPRRAPATVQGLYAALVVPVALLSTNLTFGLPLPETFPLLLILVGAAWVLMHGRIRGVQVLWLPLVFIVYGFLGIALGDPVDGVRMTAAALVFFLALQLGYEPTLPASARLVVYVLFALRIGSFIATEPFVALYRVLGLRTAEIYSGGAAVLFAEPSYLATGVLACWALGRSDLREKAAEARFLDVASLALLLMSYSASAALYAAMGALILLRKNMPVLVLGGAAVLAIAVFAFRPDRILLFFEAISSVLQSGDITTFIQLDPSAAWRLTSTTLSIFSGLLHPFGQLQLALESVVAEAEARDSLGLVSNNPLTYEFQGNLQGVTVPLQLLIFGGWPLLFLFLGVVAVCIGRLLRTGFTSPNLLLAGSIAAGVLVQSQLTNPFLYLCMARALTAPEWRGLTTAKAGRA